MTPLRRLALTFVLAAPFAAAQQPLSPAGTWTLASGNKRQGTPAEYQAASVGMSAHFGRYVVDAAHATLTFQDELSYRVPAAPDGRVPISVWRRVRPFS